MFFVPSCCEVYPHIATKLDKQMYNGFATGTVTDLSIVFLQTENWRISMDTTKTNFNLYHANKISILILKWILLQKFKTENNHIDN